MLELLKYYKTVGNLKKAFKLKANGITIQI